MKRYVFTPLATLALLLALTGCGKDRSSNHFVAQPVNNPSNPANNTTTSATIVPVALDDVEEIPATGQNGGPGVRHFLSASPFAR